MKFILLCLAIVILQFSGCVTDDNSPNGDTHDTEAPETPSGFTADVSVPYSITLRWDDNADNEDGYVLSSSENLPANTTTWTFSDLEKPYYNFELFAYNDAGISSSVWSDEIKVAWEYPVWYKVNIINTKADGVEDSQSPNGFVCVHEDSVEISFTCTVDGKEKIVDIYSGRPYEFLNLTRDNVWFTHYFHNDNQHQEKCSIWGSRVDSQEQISY